MYRWKGRGITSCFIWERTGGVTRDLCIHEFVESGYYNNSAVTASILSPAPSKQNRHTHSLNPLYIKHGTLTHHIPDSIPGSPTSSQPHDKHDSFVNFVFRSRPSGFVTIFYAVPLLRRRTQSSNLLNWEAERAFCATQFSRAQR